MPQKETIWFKLVNPSLKMSYSNKRDVYYQISIIILFSASMPCLKWKKKVSTPEMPSQTTPYKNYFILLIPRVRGIRILKDCQVHSAKTLSLPNDLIERTEKKDPTLHFPLFLHSPLRDHREELQRPGKYSLNLLNSVSLYHIFLLVASWMVYYVC